MHWRTWVGVCVLVTQAGCYDWVAVSPGELTKLNGSFATPAGPNTIAVRVVHVQRPDGSMAEISGEFDLHVHTKRGETLRFTHPVSIEEADDTLVFRGGFQGATPIDVNDIESVEVSQYSAGQTMGVVAVVSAVIAGGAYFLLTSAASKD